jgi:hypothetical protein
MIKCSRKYNEYTILIQKYSENNNLKKAAGILYISSGNSTINSVNAFTRGGGVAKRDVALLRRGSALLRGV